MQIPRRRLGQFRKRITGPYSTTTRWSTNWPGFRLLICYDDNNLDETYKPDIITATNIKEFLSLKGFPDRNKYIFNKKDNSMEKAATIILINYKILASRSVSIYNIASKAPDGITYITQV